MKKTKTWPGIMFYLQGLSMFTDAELRRIVRTMGTINLQSLITTCATLHIKLSDTDIIEITTDWLER